MKKLFGLGRAMFAAVIGACRSFCLQDGSPQVYVNSSRRPDPDEIDRFI